MVDLAGRRILCLGDIMLDRFVYGEVTRISPEAPVPVVRLKQTDLMLGGVGNVARNIASLGSTAVVIGLVGSDLAGRDLGRLLAGSAGIVDGCIPTGERPTICKTRVIATHQHVIRLDEEEASAIDAATEALVLAAIDRHAPWAAAIILSDYAKGLLTPAVVRHAIAVGGRCGIPVLVDPKQDDMAYYRGATIITPNAKELRAATGLPAGTEAEVAAAARTMLAAAGSAAILVTRSERGMMLVEAGGAVHSAPAVAREVFDVSGAGDTVIAVLALAAVAGAALPQAMRIANAAAGIVVGKLGTATLTQAELDAALAGLASPAEAAGAKVASLAGAVERVAAWRRQGLQVGFTNGCFDILHSGHVALLRAARQRCDRLVVALNTDASVARLKGPARPINPLEDRMAVIEALQAVDLVLPFAEDTPFETIAALRPNLLFKGADYADKLVVGADLVTADGGQVLLLPLVPGRSTTGIIAKSRSAKVPAA
jgi:D-beta-D-heptose 7-phosphate kinase/D-beta-D-heptose 1-phosphate adenosyltransferase